MMTEPTIAIPLPLTRETTTQLPSSIGVYFFVAKGKIIYIGKSINIKARILSHVENAKVDAKEQAIVTHADALHYVLSDSEFKSLLLESRLIKKYLPPYNTIWRDNKSYLYLKITTKDEFPKLFPVRREDDKTSYYFGPFQSLRIVNEILKDIRRVFPFCTQKKLSKKPCFYAKINLCKPCPNEINQKEGAERTRLKRQYRYSIRQIVRIFKGETDLVLTGLYKKLKTLTDEQKYEEALLLRNKISRFERLIQRPLFSSRIEEQYDTSQESSDSLLTLLRHYYPDLGPIHRIECYDMSNISFTNATASMVVFQDGLVDKSQYRKFKIKNKRANSDFVMMDEVLRRRFNTSWPQPDLVVVDGGRPQVRVAKQVLNDLRQNIPLIGIAKHPDRIVIGVENLPLVRPPVHHLGFNMIRAIRDESHRFAKKYHTYLRNKNWLPPVVV